MSERGNPSFASMVLSVLALGGIVLVLFGIGNLLYGYDPDPEERHVDWEPVVADARAVAEFDLLAPAELPDGWWSNKADFVPGPGGEWTLGVITDEGRYIGLSQSYLNEDSALARFAPPTQAVDTISISGDEWEVRESDPGLERPETAFVRNDGEITTIVTGTADRSTIIDYIASLRSE